LKNKKKAAIDSPRSALKRKNLRLKNEEKTREHRFEGSKNYEA
jgi:hypothetical protein